MDLTLPAVATGPIERVWYSEDGARLFARAAADRTFVTADLETWTAVPADQAMPVPPEDIAVQNRPEPGARVRGPRTGRSRLYAIGQFVYRSDDGGVKWASLTNFKGSSILGAGMVDLAVSPKDADELAVASETGIWRSVDGGQSWSGLNQDLPNLRVRRVLSTPQNSRGTRVAVELDSTLDAFEWQPGEKQAWRPVQDADLTRDLQLRQALTETLQAQVTAVATAGDFVYAGSADGRIWVSNDHGRTWTPNAEQYAAPVEAIYTDPRNPSLALAALGARFASAPVTARAPHVLRTINAGGFWDDLTANLPDTAAHGVAADRASGAVYAATDRGVYLAFEDLASAGPSASWSALSDSLPALRATDVRLDPGGNQLYVSLEGYGVYAAPAPHRFRAPRVVSAADLTDRAAAPGALVTVFGAAVRSAKAGGLNSPVLDSNPTKSEIQIPFEASGTSLALALEASAGTLSFGLPLQTAAPAIFIDGEGAPMALDADTGVLLDPLRPARSNTRIQILATGLGQVRPQWPSGIPAPAENPPAVIAPVRAFLDGVPLEVSRATLAPGYVGFYVIEIQIPKLVNAGPAELYLEADGQPSNRVRVYIEP
jgi:uncharacterized protein (TIGR03437 family)